MQAYDLEIFRHIGLEPTQQKILVVKSTCHFRADFEAHIRHGKCPFPESFEL